MSFNQGKPLEPLLLHISQLTDALKFHQLCRAARRDYGPVRPVRGIPRVFYADFHPEIVFQEYRFMECPIVANQPGNDGDKQCENGGA